MNGLAILFIYFALMIVVTLLFTKIERNKEKFFVADRSFGVWISGISIASTWVWAPSLFVSAERAYHTGFAGFFWFLVPNVICLLLFIPFAKRIRAALPGGVTLSGYMRNKYSERVKNIYLVELIGLATLSTVVQLVAGGKVLSNVLSLPYPIITLILAATAFTYAQYSGFRATTIAKVVQFSLMMAVCTLLVGGALHMAGSQSYFAGLGGISGEFRDLFGVRGQEVFWGFGLSATIGLLSGPFGDQTFWQRAFSTQENKIGKSFIVGAMLFMLVPISMSALGFMAAGTGFIPADGGMVNFEFAQFIFPDWIVSLFLFMLLSGLLSSVDSNLCAVPALADDIKPGTVEQSRYIMLLYLGIALLIANIPGLTVTGLFLVYGTLRASTMLPTVFTLLGVKLHEKGVFYGVIGSIALGLPMFLLGSLLNASALKVVGSLLALLTSGIVAMVVSRKEARCLAR